MWTRELRLDQIYIEMSMVQIDESYVGVRHPAMAWPGPQRCPLKSKGGQEGARPEFGDFPDSFQYFLKAAQHVGARSINTARTGQTAAIKRPCQPLVVYAHTLAKPKIANRKKLLTWSSIRMPAKPAAAYPLTVLLTFIALPYPVSPSAKALRCTDSALWQFRCKSASTSTQQVNSNYPTMTHFESWQYALVQMEPGLQQLVQ